MSQRGGGVGKVPKKCHVLFEWPLKHIRTCFVNVCFKTCMQCFYIHTRSEACPIIYLGCCKSTVLSKITRTLFIKLGNFKSIIPACSVSNFGLGVQMSYCTPFGYSIVQGSLNIRRLLMFRNVYY